MRSPVARPIYVPLFGGIGVGCESLELIYCTLLQLQGSTMVKIKILHLLCILMFEEVCGT